MMSALAFVFISLLPMESFVSLFLVSTFWSSSTARWSSFPRLLFELLLVLLLDGETIAGISVAVVLSVIIVAHSVMVAMVVAVVARKQSPPSQYMVSYGEQDEDDFVWMLLICVAFWEDVSNAIVVVSF